MVPEVVIELVSLYKNRIPLKIILEVLEVSSSTYHRWKNSTDLNTSLSDNEEAVIQICKETKYLYGYRKITALLRREMQISHNTVQRIMQKHNLNCRVRVKKHRKIGQNSFVTDNLLQRDFKTERPLEKLVTDITYLPFGPKMLYLSSVMDCFNGEIISYTIGDTQDVSFVLDTLNQLPTIEAPCILHSDQGAVYTSHSYQTQVKNKSIAMSMSRKGTPADNAPIESFHSTLKSETFYLFPELCSSSEIVSQTVINFIKYYNETRIQAKLGYVSPVEFRLQT